MTAYTYRPDLLPFALPTRIGLPYHGTVKDGQLTLPNSQTIAYGQPNSGDTTLVVSPLAAAATRTPAEQAADTARGHQWLTHAYVIGDRDQIGGAELVPQSLSRCRAWLYCTTTTTWQVWLQWSASGKVYTLSCRRFGRFPKRTEDDVEVYATLAQHEFHLLSYTDDPLSNSVSVVCWTHSQDGAITVFNLKDSTSEFAESFGCAGAIKVTMSETGGVPSAIIETLASGSDLATTSASSDPWSTEVLGVRGVGPSIYPYGVEYDLEWSSSAYNNCPASQGNEGEGSISTTVTLPTSSQGGSKTTTETRFWYFVRPNGDVKNFYSKYEIGSWGTYSAAMVGGAASGTCKDIYNCASPPVFIDTDGCEPSNLNISYASDQWAGVKWSVGVEDETMIIASAYEEQGGDVSVDFPITCQATIGYTVQNGVVASSSPYHRWVLDGEEVDEFTPPENISVLVHNNNVFDFRRTTDGVVETAFSLTISGIKFDRQGKNAVWNPRTDAVVLGDSAGQKINIV